jgi:hypothetical protein
MVGYLVVSANTQVQIEENIIDSQNELQADFKSYGYTLENPNIILNPYEISPLTALIIFETNEEEKVTITIEGKTKETTITNTFEAAKEHYIPIYGLYPDYENKIIIKSGDTTKEVVIKTDKLPDYLTTNIKNDTGKNLLVSESDYPYILDSNNEIRWYLTKQYSGKSSMLTNGNFLLSTDKTTEDNFYTGLLEIDLLGKIYKEYKISNGYYGSYAELDSSILVLSKNLLEIDKQTGETINTISLSDKYNTVNYQDNIISLTNETTLLKINKDTQESTTDTIDQEPQEQRTTIDFYTSSKNYKLETGISFEIKHKTATSNKNIYLINYKNPDNNYNNYNIELTKETDRLVVSGDFNLTDEVYIILDKFMDKKVYDVEVKDTTTYKYINQEGLEGKYSIYIKINNKLYKTNQYVTF